MSNLEKRFVFPVKDLAVAAAIAFEITGSLRRYAGARSFFIAGDDCPGKLRSNGSLSCIIALYT
jgi:hypothetical protein